MFLRALTKYDVEQIQYLEGGWVPAMKPEVQLEPTGCAIASVAAIAGLSYSRTKLIAHFLGIQADDTTLWSGTSHVRKLLRHFGFTGGPREIPFRSWNELPDLALLSIKWHLKQGRPS